MMSIDKDSRIYIAGHKGLVGSAICRELQKQGYKNIIIYTHNEVDLTNQIAVKWLFEDEKPDYVFLAAAYVGGILSNMTYPVEFLYKNTMIEMNVIKCAFENGVKRLMMLGSSCIMPIDTSQPIKEEYFLTGKLEPTNEAYAIAKIAGIKLCEYYNRQYGTNYISVMPCSLYGQNDNFDLQNSHLIPALVRKMHEAKTNNYSAVEIWGSGKPLREFLYVDDMANACIFLMNNYFDNQLINIGCGYDYSVKQIAEIIKDIVGYDGELVFDESKPDGVYRKLLDVSKINSLGWKPKIDLKQGIEIMYRWYCNKM